MRRFFLIIACLFCMLPALQAQSQTDARLWLDCSKKEKQSIVFGFILGGLAMEEKMVDKFYAIGRFDEWKKDKPAVEIKEKSPGRPAQKEPWQRSFPVLIAAMDSFYRRSENRDIEIHDALYTVIFEPETAEKKIDNDEK